MPAIITTASASMPASCRGEYRHVRIVAVCHWILNHNPRGWDWQPPSVRSKEVIRVLRDYGPQSVGKTERCAYQRTLKAAQEWALAYNSAGDAATAEDLIGAGGSA